MTLLLLGGGVFVALSCDSFIHDEQVVASVSGTKLYRSQLEKFVPKGISSEDSAAIADSYIKKWATDVLYLEVAEKQLSEEDQDVSAELTDYRRSLLRYRYEQRYVDDRLDTLVSQEQMDEYYQAHKDMFRLERPVLKLRFVSLIRHASGSDEILDLLSSDERAELDRLDTLAYRYAVKYFDATDRWMDAAAVSEEFGMTWKEMLEHKKGTRIRVVSGANVKEAYVADMVESGYAPVGFCAARIRDILLNERKRALLITLEQDLLATAAENNRFVIY